MSGPTRAEAEALLEEGYNIEEAAAELHVTTPALIRLLSPPKARATGRPRGRSRSPEEAQERLRGALAQLIEDGVGHLALPGRKAPRGARQLGLSFDGLVWRLAVSMATLRGGWPDEPERQARWLAIAELAVSALEVVEDDIDKGYAAADRIDNHLEGSLG